jgi:hypothetical protein
MKATYLLLLVGLALVAGCAQRSSTYEVYVSPDLSPELQEAAFTALTGWEDTTAGSARSVHFNAVVGKAGCADHGLLPVGGQWHAICIVPSTVATNVGMGATQHNTGITFRVDVVDGATVHIAVDEPGLKDATNRVKTMGHELGHALGLVHHTGHFLMNPLMDADQAEEPTADDVAQFEAL